MRASRMPSLAVAVLYSGRFYGELTAPEWSKDHLNNLIVPNRAAVFVVVDPVNVCDTSGAVQRALGRANSSKWEAASLALLQEARAIFGGWDHLYAKVVPPVKATDVEQKFKQVRATSKPTAACSATAGQLSFLPSGPAVVSTTLLLVLMRLAPEPHPQRAQAGRLAKTLGWQDALTDNRKATLYNWEKQFELIRQGVAFVLATASSDGAEPFDVVVRMRMVRDQPNKNRPAPVAPLFGCLLGDPSPLPARALLAAPQDVHLAVPRVFSHRAIPNGVVMALGYWAVLDPDRFTVNRPSSRACRRDPRCTQRLQVFWHDWVYAGSQSSIAKVAQVAQARSYLVNLTTRCLGLCQEEQTVLQLEALGVPLSPLGWRGTSIRRLAGSQTRLVGGGPNRGPCSVGRAVLTGANRPPLDADEDVYAVP